MSISFGSLFRLEVRPRGGWLFARLPWIGQVYIDGDWEVTWDSWRTLKDLREV